MSLKRIVITGAPGTGKTVVVEGIEAEGYPCFHEIIRSMTAKAKKDGTKKIPVSNPLAFVDDPLKFNQLLLEGRLAHFKEAENLDVPVSFFDRGMPDVLAYMDYFKQSYAEEFSDTCKDNRYDAIFIMPPWKEIYVSDNERLETFTEAEQLHENLMNSYKAYGYSPISVPKTTIPERISFILKELKLI
ncbi:ATP-binding protein [uncultured Croceitalea sp.]|uniref:ATP-binding protein n=1 Tax=uncultured Croceitalea sp. TaxID=1798908 RepID=UPI0033057044